MHYEHTYELVHNFVRPDIIIKSIILFLIITIILVNNLISVDYSSLQALKIVLKWLTCSYSRHIIFLFSYICCIYVCIHTYIHNIYIYIYIYIYLYVYMYICIYVFLIQIYLFIHYIDIYQVCTYIGGIFLDVFLYIDATVPLHRNINSRAKHLKLLFIFLRIFYD